MTDKNSDLSSFERWCKRDTTEFWFLWFLIVSYLVCYLWFKLQSFSHRYMLMFFVVVLLLLTRNFIYVCNNSIMHFHTPVNSISNFSSCFIPCHSIGHLFIAVLVLICIVFPELLFNCWPKWQWQIQCHWLYVVCVWLSSNKDTIQKNKCSNSFQWWTSGHQQLYC
jgi:hypothetical protein